MHKFIYIAATTVFAALTSMVVAMGENIENDTGANILSRANSEEFPETICIDESDQGKPPMNYSSYNEYYKKRYEIQELERQAREEKERDRWEQQKNSDIVEAEKLAPLLTSSNFSVGVKITLPTGVILKRSSSGVYLTEPTSPTKGVRSPTTGNVRKVILSPSVQERTEIDEK